MGLIITKSEAGALFCIPRQGLLHAGGADPDPGVLAGSGLNIQNQTPLNISFFWYFLTKVKKKYLYLNYDDFWAENINPNHVRG